MERLSRRSEQESEHIRRSVRVFCVAPKRSELLESELAQGASINSLSLVEVVLARKNNTKFVTALGGRLMEGEDLLHAAGRKVFEESLLTRESQKKLELTIGSGSPIPYTRNDTGTRCEAFLTVMPVRSATVSMHQPRENREGKSVYEISELVSVSVQELTELFSIGKVITSRGEELHMFGHLTEVQVPDVSLSPSARKIQNRELARVLDEIVEYEYQVRNEVVDHVNRLRRLHHKPRITSLGECGKDEIVRGYILAKWSLGMADNRLREVNGEVKPTIANDLPTSALYLREVPPEYLADALMVVPTQELRKQRNAIVYALQKTVGIVYEHMGYNIRELGLDGETRLGPIDLIAALRNIWPQVVQRRSHEAVTDLLRELDHQFTLSLCEHLKKSYTVVRRALALVPEIPPYLAKELRGVKRDTFQEFFPPNEVASAMERPFFQMLHIAGIHPYRNVPVYPEDETTKRNRGEILMQFAIQLSAIPAAEQQLNADNILFEKVLAEFLVFPPKIDQLKLRRTPHTVMRRKTEKPVDGSPMDLWHDQPLAKEVIRVWLKGLQENKVYDMFRHNFVIRDSNFSEEDIYNIPLRLDKSRALREALVTHFQEELQADGWTVSIVPGTLKTGVIDTARKMITVESPKERRKLIAATKYKKRSGSIANIIVREKFVLALAKGSKVHYTEICIYPIEQVNIKGAPLYKSGLIGFVEKILDDMSGEYNGYRLLKTDENDPTAPSTHEVIRPPVWQQSAYDPIWAMQHKPKPRRKRKM